MDLVGRIDQIKKEIRETPYHKATEHHIGHLRAKLSKLEKRLAASQKSKGGGLGFNVKKSGDATVVLVGPPSVGKSTLINQLTKAHSRTGDFDFTTLTVIPGMMEYKGAQIQILDIPGLIGGAAKGKGRGREVLSVARTGDLILLMADIQNLPSLPQLRKELKESGIDKIPIITVVNKIDQVPSARRAKIKKEDAILISAQKKEGLEELKKVIFKKLHLIRVYLKPPQGKPDRENPLILKEGDTVFKAAGQISNELPANLKTAQIWGRSVKYPGQYVSLSHQLRDKDILSFLKH